MAKVTSAIGCSLLSLAATWVNAEPQRSNEANAVVAASDSDGVNSSYLVPQGANSELHLIARRAARLAQVAHPPIPPEIAEIPNEIDRFIAAAWQQAPPAKREPRLCEDATFLRRVYLDVTGVMPTMAETREFLADSTADKRRHLIDKLLSRNVDYAAHWTPFWLDALASSTNTTFGGVVSRGNYMPWIIQSFQQNKPFDVFAAELIDPTMPGFKQPVYQDILGVNYKVSFLRDASTPEVQQTAADIGQIFLGTGMKCASCHDHFENDEWPQSRFLGFAGFFAPQDLEQIRCEQHLGNVVPTQWPFEQPGIPTTASGDAKARLHLAALLMTDPTNPRFAKTIVNRLWKRYLGLGLVEPVDDFRNERPASHPELLDWLSYDFMQHGYDLKHTIRLILNSRTYQLAYDPLLTDSFDVQDPHRVKRWYRSPMLRRLTAEQLLDSIRLAVFQQLIDDHRVYRTHEGVPVSLTESLGRPDVRSEVSTARSGEPTVIQALELLNSQAYNDLTAPPQLLNQLRELRDRKQIVEAIYLATLARGPTTEELDLGTQFLAGPESVDEPPLPEALQDMLWAIFTSPMFQYIY